MNGVTYSCPHTGDFILKKLAQQMTPKASVEVMIKELATTFPAFQDHMKIEKTLNVVSFLDKAQHLMSDLYFRFRDETDVVQSFDFSDMNLLTCSSDPDTCSYLRGLNILEIKTKLASQLDRDVELSQGTFFLEGENSNDEWVLTHDITIDCSQIHGLQNYARVVCMSER